MNFLSIQGSYNKLEISLFLNETCIDKIQEDNKRASSILVPTIQALLEKHDLTLSDLKFIAADQGPGAFTSLRVTVTTIDGISFASKTPLIGIDGIKALYLETSNNDDSDTIVMLNAYSKDIFYGYHENELHTGYENIDKFLDKLDKNKHYTFCGNATTMYKEKLSNFKNSKISTNEIASTEIIAKLALEKWKSKETSEKLLPLYLKTQSFKKAKN